MSINIKRVSYSCQPDIFDLLLLADPDITAINSYIEESTLLVAMTSLENPVGVLVYQKKAAGHVELMNMAVAETYRGQGVGETLISVFLDGLQQEKLQEQKTTVVVRTGDLSVPAIALYEKMGFKVDHINHDYFIANYPDPIYEFGKQLKHQVVLTQIIR